MKNQLILGCLFLLFSSVVSATSYQHEAKATLNNFHQAAANANQEAYFQLMHDDFIFLGTDGSERWTKQAFEDFVRPYFSKGVGWRYTPTEQNITKVSAEILFFDELLSHKKYGQCRGSGVLVKVGATWQLMQYNLSIPVPNGLAGDVVKQIKQFNKEQAK